MKNKTQPPRTRQQKRRRAAARLCSLLGTLIMAAVVAVYLPLTVPQYLGYGVYQIISGSMAPAIPVDSVVLVQPCRPEDVQAGAVIAFFNGTEQPVVHRVAENHTVEGEFVTKGDANAQQDPMPAPYSALLGKVVFCIPVLGRLADAVSTVVGKFYAFGFLVAAVLFHVLAGQLRALSEPEAAGETAPSAAE